MKALYHSPSINAGIRNLHHNGPSLMSQFKYTTRRFDCVKRSPSTVQARSFSTKDVKNDPSDRITQFAMLVEKDLPSSPNLKDILNGVWKNEVVTSQCPDLVIRLTSLRGQVSKRIWERRGNNPDDIQILAVGTVAIPHHLKSYHNFLQNFWNNTEKYANEARRAKGNDYEVGYDLLSKGSDQAREAVLKLWNEHYGFPEQHLKSCISNSAIISGGMRGLKDIADGLILRAKADNAPHRFIQPDNSFGTWWNIIERPEKNDSFRRQIFTVAARPENKLHLTAEDVDKHYKTNSPVPFESWYITPVGNPSGTAMSKEQLLSTCQRILHHNPKAVIVLDVVYVRTMTRKDAKHIMSGVVNDANVLDRVVFLESFSKSHGLCRERIGMYFSTNEKLFTTIHASNIAFSAGPGHHKDYQFLALGNSSTEDKKATDELHEFWQRERKGLYNFLMSNKNKHLFEDKQVHIRPEDMDKPCTLYILMKTREGVKAQDIFMNTGILGVDTPMLSGHYVRFSLGTLLNPAFSKYL